MGEPASDSHRGGRGAAKSWLRRSAESALYSDASVGTWWWLFGRTLRRRPLRTLFILSHMRSGSSLLVHLLNTNPAVFGFGETFLSYATPRDLRRLPLKVFVRTGRTLRDQAYVVDKILHRRLLDPEVLRDPSVRAVFLLRAPEQALPSLARAASLPGWWQSERWTRDRVDPEVVADYYCGRLDTLARCARALGDPERCVLVTYEQLVAETQAVFGALSRLLDLPQGFSEEYGLLETTGRPGVGDPSEHIRKGFVDRGIRREPVEIPLPVQQRATAAYARCRATLEERCSPVRGGGAAPAGSGAA